MVTVFYEEQFSPELRRGENALLIPLLSQNPTVFVGASVFAVSVAQPPALSPSRGEFAGTKVAACRFATVFASLYLAIARPNRPWNFEAECCIHCQASMEPMRRMTYDY
ncbi:hypothetical protein AKJ16_DCAP21170, partial [Drosera capensis]